MRVVIAEDLFLLREGLSSLLKQYGYEVAEAVDNGPDLLEALTQHQPDVAIVDVRLPPTPYRRGPARGLGGAQAHARAANPDPFRPR